MSLETGVSVDAEAVEPAAGAGAASETQRRIDERLDLVDRALIGLLPRAERLAIVARIETQVRETGSEVAPLPADAALAGSAAGPSRASRRRQRSTIAYSSGVLGLIALGALFIAPVTYILLAVLGDGMGETIAIGLMGTHALVIAVSGTLAVVLGVIAFFSLWGRGKKSTGHGWAITGVCAGALPMLVGAIVLLSVGAALAETELFSVHVSTTSTPASVATCAPGMPCYGQPVPVSMTASYPAPLLTPPPGANPLPYAPAASAPNPANPYAPPPALPPAFPSGVPSLAPPSSATVPAAALPVGEPATPVQPETKHLEPATNKPEAKAEPTVTEPKVTEPNNKPTEESAEKTTTDSSPKPATDSASSDD
jgi:hypothetical protein